MRRLVLTLAALVAVAGFGRSALAQDQEENPTPPGEEKPKPATPAPVPETPPGEEKGAGTAGAKQWQDIVVVPRKAVLKGGRLELAPFAGLTINDPLIRHWGFGGQLNYFFSDVFGVGLEGIYYKREITTTGGLIGLQYHRVPTLNEMKWAASLDFSYVPIYGKFALFNQSIIHWEASLIGGVGITHTTIIPRNPSDATFDNDDITPSLGVGGRVFLSQWLAIWFNLRDYVYPDKFESPTRMGGTGEMAKANADSAIVNDVFLCLGASFFVPPTFSYHTPR
jgi:outer membrane beta-barrel protein